MDGKTDQQDKVLDERRPTVFNYFCTSFNNGPIEQIDWRNYGGGGNEEKIRLSAMISYQFLSNKRHLF